MNRLAKLIIVAIAVCGSIVAASATSTAAEPACPVGKFDHQLKWDGQSCIDPTALSAKDQDVLDAKSAAAKTYSAYLGGASTSNAVTAADAAVQAKSGATLVTPKSANSIAPDSLSGYTLRAWRGDSYYQQLPTSSMTQAIEYSDISYDTDRQFPVVENVLYNSSSYYPSGFNPGLQYQHFDTLSGHFDVGGVSYVEQGQVYGSPGYTYVAYQTFTLATQWSAVAQWHGIVW
jgi:hypothetical protein